MGVHYCSGFFLKFQHYEISTLEWQVTGIHHHVYLIFAFHAPGRLGFPLTAERLLMGKDIWA